jgi:hypothetical protein
MNLGQISQTKALYRQLLALRSEIAAAVQEVYDGWEQGEDCDLGSGGICDLMAEAIGSVLNNHNIDFTDGGQEGDDHAFVIAFDPTDAYVVDVPYHLYESGSGFSWTKIEGVIFSADDIEVVPVARPDWIGQ